MPKILREKREYDSAKTDDTLPDGSIQIRIETGEQYCLSDINGYSGLVTLLSR